MGLKSDIYALKASSLISAGASNSATVVDVSSYEAGAVYLSISAKTGTFTSYLFGLQVSMDGGTTWSGIGSQAAPLGAPASLSAAADISTGNFWFAMNNFAGPLVRLAWNIIGGTNATFAATLAVRR